VTRPLLTPPQQSTDSMHKTVIAPGQGPLASDDLDEPQVSLAVATHHEDCTRVEINGLVYPEGGIREQYREILGLVAKILADLDGSPTDLVKLRHYVATDALDEDARPALHEVRAEFVDRPHYPASCLVEVPAVGVEGADLEVEARATIPDDGWEVETITGEG
jgi:enamine deaminase RidA (YjgF/YER057c/UK114 family)